jgi:hypothetical protein
MTFQTEVAGFIKRELPMNVASDREAFLSNALSSERLVVSLAPALPRMRGHLADVIFDAIEWTLREHGAVPVDARFSSPFEETLQDFVYRARLLGAAGLALDIQSLEEITDEAGVLDPEDSATLLGWLEASETAAVQLLVPSRLRDLKVYPAPVALKSLLPNAKEDEHGAVIEYEPLEGEDAQAISDLDDADYHAEEAARLSLIPPSLEAFSGELEPHPSSLPTADFSAREPIEPFRNLVPAHRPSDSELASKAVAWIRELETTRGPKPLSVIERLYSSAYLPLRHALALGQAPSDAEAVLREWAESFEKSYREAFQALRQRAKHPPMIMDLPDTAQRLARLHGARNVQLVLVDGMRFDLGQKVNDRLQVKLAQRAACAERFTLWAGLPATTATQLELLGRGANALQEFSGELDDELVVNRGRTATLVRRIRTGHRDVLKLDLVEARITGQGGREEERLEQIAEEVSSCLAVHIEGLPSGTLVLVFGDHGFIFDTDEDGNTRGARKAGAKPEEVLVPAFAWLAGSVH